MNDRTKIRNIICAVLSIILAAVLGYLIYTDQQQEKEQAATVEALQEEAKEYENELQDLRSELSSLQSNVSYSSEDAEIMVAIMPPAAAQMMMKADIFSLLVPINRKL